MKFDGEKKELLFVDNNNKNSTSRTSSSNQKSLDRLKSSINRKNTKSISSEKRFSSKDYKISEICKTLNEKALRKLSSCPSAEKSLSTDTESSSKLLNLDKKFKFSKKNFLLDNTVEDVYLANSRSKSSSSSSKDKSLIKLKENHKEKKNISPNLTKNLSNPSSLSSEHRSSKSSSSKQSNKSSRKRNRSSEKFPSSQNKHKKSLDDSKTDKKNQITERINSKDLIGQELQNIKEENKKLIIEMFDKFKEKTIKIVEDSLNSRKSERLTTEDLDSMLLDEELVRVLVNKWLAKSRVNYSKNKEDQNIRIPFQKVGFEEKCIKIEIPEKNIEKLRNSEVSNENFTRISTKSEIIDGDEFMATPIDLDSKPNIILNKIKLEPQQPNCSKDLSSMKIKQEIVTDCSEYFRILPQNFNDSTNPNVTDSKAIKTLVDMSLINKWIASQNKNHGFKDKRAFDFMMSRNSLFSLFKCMGVKCCYTTISYENFLNHLNIHVEENCSANDYFLNCAYCLNRSTDPIDLIKHYKNEHFNCIYQCNLCFYRAAEQQSVYDHHAHYHKYDSRKLEILECPCVFPKEEKIEELKAIDKIKNLHQSIICESCFKNFSFPEDYIKHLKSSHQSEKEKLKSDEEINKININFTNNIIGKYQCLECDASKPFGSNNKFELRAHLHHHPSKLHFVCVRDTDKYKHIRIKSRGDLQIIKYTGNLEVLKNTEEAFKITIN